MRVCLAELPRHWVILAKDKSGLHLDEYHLIEFKDMPLKEYDRETKAVLLLEDPKCLQPQEFWQTKSFLYRRVIQELLFMPPSPRARLAGWCDGLPRSIQQAQI